MAVKQNSPIADTPIQKDRMNLTVNNVLPVVSQTIQDETRQEISIQLYQIFQKYAK